MPAINGSASWGIVPYGQANTNIATMSWEYRESLLFSANDQLRYQVQWQKSNLTEGIEVGSTGDVVNVVFKIETSVDNIYWKTLGVVKKARDITNRKYDDGSAPKLHRFTIDVSALVKDELSYSLCPLLKGTWQSNVYGGMNGGLTIQDNVIGGQATTGTGINRYAITDNGTFRYLKVSATFEVFDDSKQLTIAEINGSVQKLSPIPTITCINSVNQFEEDSTYYRDTYQIRQSTNIFKFLTRYPINNFKSVRINEPGEFLQFYINISNYIGIVTGSTVVGAMAIKIETFEDNAIVDTFYLRDFEDNLLSAISSNGNRTLRTEQNQMCIQNISPGFIENSVVSTPDDTRITTPSNFPYWNNYTGNKILPTTDYYRASLVKRSLVTPVVEKVITGYHLYRIDRENTTPYGFVRFHWLNSMGGIDSYTAKRDVVESFSISKDIVNRKSADRTWYQADSHALNNSESNIANDEYISDTMRGGDIYKGGREVLNVNADKINRVYTEPLNFTESKWLKQLMLSPNVWIELTTEATTRGNDVNPYLRPSAHGYIPVIISNSEIDTVNQSEGLVKFNIEYILSHKVVTQRN